MIEASEAAAELLRRRAARRHLFDYIRYTNPKYKPTGFARAVCSALDQFLDDAMAGKRPILILQAPPQHGKSEIVSRKLPAYLLGRYPDLHVGAASYSDPLANSMSQAVRRNLASAEHAKLFPNAEGRRRYDVDRNGEFTAPGGSGTYLGVGVGSGLTGRSVDVGIIDDPTKNAKEALSPTVKGAHWDWYQTVFKTRLSEDSAQIIMATSWAEDDLPGRIAELHRDDPRLRVLRFPAINSPGEAGYNPQLQEGALCPELHSIEQLLEFKREMSDYWWSAMYQQCPKPLGGNIFKDHGVRYYMPSDLPAKFDKVIASWDCTFKDTDGTDFVVGQVWGKLGARAYLLDQRRARMSFTETCREVVQLRNKWPQIREILIEDKANGPAVIDTLKHAVPGLIPIEPDGSKVARAHAVTAFWEAGNVWLPDPTIAPWVKDLIGELTAFPASANDDQVDGLTQALRRLFPLRGGLKISAKVLALAGA